MIRYGRSLFVTLHVTRYRTFDSFDFTFVVVPVHVDSCHVYISYHCRFILTFHRLPTPLPLHHYLIYDFTFTPFILPFLICLRFTLRFPGDTVRCYDFIYHGRSFGVTLLLRCRCLRCVRCWYICSTLRCCSLFPLCYLDADFGLVRLRFVGLHIPNVASHCPLHRPHTHTRLPLPPRLPPPRHAMPPHVVPRTLHHTHTTTAIATPILPPPPPISHHRLRSHTCTVGRFGAYHVTRYVVTHLTLICRTLLLRYLVLECGYILHTLRLHLRPTLRFCYVCYIYAVVVALPYLRCCSFDDCEF